MDTIKMLWWNGDKNTILKRVDFDLPSTSVSSSCEEKATQATRKKAANRKHLTSILMGADQRPEGMGKGGTGCTFYKAR